LQHDFSRAAAVKIAVIDLDWFRINYAANYREGTDPQELKAKLLTQFIYERTGQRMSRAQIDAIAENVLNDTGESYQLAPADAGAGVNRVCVVFGERADMSAREQALTALALHPLTHGDLVGNAKLKNQPPLSVLNRLTDYHEIGHCMDDWFQPEANRADKAADKFTYDLLHHEAETFADVYALLMIARDGDVDARAVAEYRANMRLASVALSGPIRTQLTAESDPGHEGGYIYAIHKAVRAAGAEIDRLGTARLQAMSMNEVRDLARRITEENALKDPAQEAALTYMLAQNFDLSRLGELRRELPYLENRYRIATGMKEEMNTAVRAVLDLRGVPAHADILGTIPFNARALYLVPRIPEALARRDAEDMTAALLRGSASREELLMRYTHTADALRAQLKDGSDAEQQDAARKLRAMPEALARAMRLSGPRLEAHAAPLPPKAPMLRA
jgi:hypothetical protein